MYNRQINTITSKQVHSQGAALVFALIALAVLTSLAFTLTSTLAGRKHRQQYLIDHQAAKYACDSATKYAMDKMGELKVEYAQRNDQPDFSDLFWMNKEEYESMLQSWAEQIDEKKLEESQSKKKEKSVKDNEKKAEAQGNKGNVQEAGLADMLLLFGLADPNMMDDDQMYKATDPNTLAVPGPYGPVWPLVAKAQELEIGNVKVTVTIEDENAKLPILLAMSGDEETKREREACFMSFFEWMGAEKEDVDIFFESADSATMRKKFTKKLKDIQITKQEPVETSVSEKSRRGTSRSSKKTARTKMTTTKRPEIKHMTDYVFVLDAEFDKISLGRVLSEFDGKKESLLKYMGVYGSSQINVNSAPRHVLEAVLNYGGDSDSIADQIIIERQVKPFKNYDDLKERLFRYSDSLEKCKDMLVTDSIYFSVHIRAVSGGAVVENVCVVMKIKNAVTKIATISN